MSARRIRAAAASAPRRLPAPVLFLAGGTSMYVGAALAVGLFDRLAPHAVAELRLIGAALVLLAWRRPGRAAWAPRRLLLATVFGRATALMNVAYYEAIARLPLGTAVALEFCGRCSSRPWRRGGPATSPPSCWPRPACS